MKILHISTTDKRGGACLAAYRLHQAMIREGNCTSTMLVQERHTADPSVCKVRLSNTITNRIKRRLDQLQVIRDRRPYTEALSKVELFSDDRGHWLDTIPDNLAGFDIIQLHWVCEFLHYNSFFKNARLNVPLVWRLADMNPLTGGCHYDGGCGRFAVACGRCPQLKSQKDHDLSNAVLNRKREGLSCLSDSDLHLVALNEWMAGQVRRSSLLARFECSVIPNGVDLEDFRPIEPRVAREALGIPADSHVLVFVSDVVENVRKGFHFLLEAIDALRERRDLFLLIVGDARRLPPMNLPSLRVGHVQAVAFLRQIYSAASLFVIPSLEDNQPNTVLEAMACKTPVVGFRTGGIPELVDEGTTGLLAKCGSVRDLTRAIEFLLDNDDERTTMGANARSRVENMFSRSRQVDKYLELYSRLIAKRQVKSAEHAYC